MRIYLSEIKFQDCIMGSLMQKYPTVKSETESKLASTYKALEERICSGGWPVGAVLPTEYELAAEYHCGRNTVSKAIAQLAHEGFVERKRRAGTRVIRNSSNRNAASVDLDAFAFIYPSEQHDGIWRTAKGFQEAANEVGRRVVMLTTGLDYQKEAEFISRLSEFDVRGAVVYPILPTPQDQVHFSQLLVDLKFPVVLAEINLPGLGCSSVVVDGLRAGYTMARHLIQRGAKKIGFFSNFAWAPFMRDRYQGYRWALEEAGMSEPARGVYLVSAMHPNFQDPLAEPRALAEQFLDQSGKLDAVVCADDFLALGCIIAAQKRGWVVPRDMLVSGIGDYSSLVASNAVPLTTYRIPFEELGRQTFLVLEKIRCSEMASPEERHIRGEIVIREST
ncbi:MAG: substrate-binding domain-containing protein [Chthoniobacteraceae bacterium]